MRFILLILVALSTSAQAGEFWSKDKTTNGFIIADHVLTVIDWAQTRYIADHPDEFHEDASSQFLGEHPTTGEVNRYFVVSTLLVDAAGYFLPEEYTLLGVTFSPKKALYIVDSVREGYYVQHNYEIGIRGQF